MLHPCPVRRKSRGNPTASLVAPIAAALMTALLAAGCASGGNGTGTRSDIEYGAPTAELAVERFLAAANAEEYDRMGALFGTARGPAEQELGLNEVELRMIVLAAYLKHQDARVRQEELLSLEGGRIRFVAQLTGTREGNVAVPIVAVPSAGGRWFVERVEMDAVTDG